MTPQVDRQDPQLLGQGGQDRPIGAGVETVGVREDDVDRPRLGTEVERGHGAAAT